MIRLPKWLQIPKPKGFTVIELLVVLAIIAALFAILFPVFNGARDNAKGALGDTAVITVNRRERVTEGYGDSASSRYLIFTDQGEVFEDTDNMFIGKYNSSDIYGQLHEGHTYQVRVVGYRDPVWSAYRNIVAVEGEVTDGGQVDEHPG